MSRRGINRHRGHLLSKQQLAVAAVLAQAISNYSEDSFCAGWYMGIEHELWERIVKRKPDAYERSVKKLYAIAGKEQSDWGKPIGEFVAGLEVLAKKFKVWVYYDKGETAIHLKDWRSMHESWHLRHLQKRLTLEEVWQRIHEPFPRLKSDEKVQIPPMPKVR